MAAQGRTKPRGRPQRSWKAFVAKAGEKHQTPSFGKRSKEKPKESGKTQVFLRSYEGHEKEADFS
jgi:hypothetical protein